MIAWFMSFFGLGTSVKSTLIEFVCLCMLSWWVFIEIWIQESWGSKTPLNRPYCCTQDWTQTWRLVSQTRRIICLSWDPWALVRQQCHINTALLSPYLGTQTLLSLKCCLRLIGSFDFEDSLVWDPSTIKGSLLRHEIFTFPSKISTCHTHTFAKSTCIPRENLHSDTYKNEIENPLW